MNKRKKQYLTYKQKKKRILFFLIKQLLILLVFLTPLYQAKPIPEDKCTQVSVVVEDVDYRRVVRSNTLVIVSDSVEYRFPARGFLDKEYSNYELQQKIQKGDKLTITVVDNYSILGKTKLILDARTETEVYRSLEVTNSGREFMMIFLGIVFAVVEVLFIVWQMLKITKFSWIFD